MKKNEIIIIPFFLCGPGNLHAKDISFPYKIHCRNSNIILITISKHKIMRGHFLIEKCTILNLVYKNRYLFLSNYHLASKKIYRKFKIRIVWIYPWLNIGYPINEIERVGFRIELRKFRNKKLEYLIIEIFTIGNISLRYALNKTSVFIINKFINFTQRILPIYFI